MRIPPIDLCYLRDQFDDMASGVIDAWDAAGHGENEEGSPILLREAWLQLIDMLGHFQGEEPALRDNVPELNTLGEYGLHLIDEMAHTAVVLEQPALAAAIENLCLPFAVWTARHGGEIRSLAPVVNALARFANHADRVNGMAMLYSFCCELVDATSPSCQEQLNNDPRHPWRLLLINRAIVATRSHNADLMTVAFDAIVDNLPNEAHRFFAEGMEQMTIVDYPPHVQEVVRRYFMAHAGPKRLH